MTRLLTKLRLRQMRRSRKKEKSSRRNISWVYIIINKKDLGKRYNIIEVKNLV